jgi:hypothetical protein
MDDFPWEIPYFFTDDRLASGLFFSRWEWETRHFEWVNHRKSSISVGQGFLGKL